MRKIKMMLSAWCLVASGQWLVASAVLPTLGGRAPYVGGTLSLRWRGALGDRALPRRSGRGRPPGGPEVGRGKQQAYNNKLCGSARTPRPTSGPLGCGRVLSDALVKDVTRTLRYITSLREKKN